MISGKKAPKYLVMAEKFRKDILSGTYQEGERLPSDEEIAKNCGINKRTVAAGMAQLVAEGLISRAPKRGSVVVRRKIVTRNSDVVACVAPIVGDIYRNIEANITENLMKRGFYPFWMPSSVLGKGVANPEQKPFQQFMEYLINTMPYGMIVFGDRFIPYDMIERNLAKIEKLVFICYYVHSRDLPAKYVLIDYEAAAKKVVSAFLRKGHRRMTFITTTVNVYRKYHRNPPQYYYHLALKNACREMGMEYDEEIPALCWKNEPSVSIFRKILKRKITAAALSFDAALAGYHADAIRELNVKIPQDLSVIGFFNTFGDAGGLSTLDIHERTIANLATEMLFEKGSETRKVLIAPELIERRSILEI